MATTVFLRSEVATTHRGTNTAKLNGSTSGWLPKTTSTTRGSTLDQATTDTVAGATNGVDVSYSNVDDIPVEWLTPPVDQDVTISGAITGNIWAAESNMSANVAINFVVDKVAAVDGTITQIVKSARTTEVAVTTAAVNNFTATPGAGVALAKGDRLRIRIFGDDAGTMGAGFIFFVWFNGSTGGASGDTFITFNETFGFQTTDPTGTTIYPTNTVSDVNTADPSDFRMWTSRGDAAVSVTRALIAGWNVPLRFTSGDFHNWFTPQLQAFTLSGLIKCNIRANNSTSTGNASIGVEIARVDADGSNEVIWGYANRDAATTSGGAGENATSETAYTVYVAGDDLAVSDGQRLRLRMFLDDCADIPTAASGNVGFFFDGPTGGASGDSFLILEQTVAEFVATTPAARITRPRTPTSHLVITNRGDLSTKIRKSRKRKAFRLILPKPTFQPTIITGASTSRARGKASAAGLSISVASAHGRAHSKSTVAAFDINLSQAHGRAHSKATASGFRLSIATASGRAYSKATAVGTRLVVASAQGRSHAKATAISLRLVVASTQGRAHSKATATSLNLAIASIQGRAKGRATATGASLAGLITASAHGRAHTKATATAVVTIIAAVHGRAYSRATVAGGILQQAVGSARGYGRATFVGDVFVAPAALVPITMWRYRRVKVR